MPVETRPPKLPRWATGGGATVVEPSEGAKDAGFVAGATADEGQSNWLGRETYEFLRYADQRLAPVAELIGSVDVQQSGLIITGSSGSLVGTIAAGVVYLGGYRVELTAEKLANEGNDSHTFTASRDTYVGIDIDGALEFNEVSNGAAAPSPSAGFTHFAKVVTDGTEITSVSYLFADSLALNEVGIFGDGSDGDISLPSNGTMTRDHYWNNLTLQAGVALSTNGYRAFVRGTLIIEAGASMGRDGGTGTSIPAEGTLLGGINGGAGAVGPGSGAGAPGAANSFAGDGGEGGDANAGLEQGGAGGNAIAPAAKDGNIRHAPAAVLCVANGLSGGNVVHTPIRGGGGGGGGACFTSGQSGGDGGQGGGVVMIAAQNVVNRGTIHARGGPGGDGSGGDSAGGGGGGGGFVQIVCKRLTGEGVIDVSGGSGGASTGVDTTDGADGGAGSSRILYV